MNGRTAVDRFEAGVALATAGKAPVLVFTGGWLPWQPDATPEGEVLRDRAIGRGIAADRIAVTGIVRNTEEESRAVARTADRPRTRRAQAIDRAGDLGLSHAARQARCSRGPACR